MNKGVAMWVRLVVAVVTVLDVFYRNFLVLILLAVYRGQ